jgi:hypothetical protein
MEANLLFKNGRRAKTLALKAESFKKARDRLGTIWSELNYSLTKSFSERKTASTDSLSYQNLANNPCITKEIHRQILPHLLPETHPMKAPLDVLFHKSGVNYNQETMQKAGFTTVSLRPYTFLIVVKHETLPGHLLKVYFQSEMRIKRGTEGWQWLMQRCEGAEKIRNLIRHKKLTHFSVPDKWLYPLPPKRSPSKKCGQPVILVSTEMDLVSQEKSHDIWKNEITTEVLDELYILLTYGLASTHVSWNIPASNDGTFACIDTEHPQRKPDYGIVNQYLSDKMSQYWDSLIQKGKIPTTQRKNQ